MQNVFGRVGVDVPFLEQCGFEGEFAGVGDERVEELARDIAHFRPVVGARVLLILDEHAKPQNAALLRGVGKRRRRDGNAEHAVGRGGRGAEDGREREELAAVDRAILGVGGPSLEAFTPKLVLERVSDHDVLPVILFKPSRAARESGFSLSAVCAPSELRNDGNVPANSIRRGAEYPGALFSFCLASRHSDRIVDTLVHS